MYQIISNLLNIPDTYANSTITYVAGALVVLITILLADMVFRLIKSVFGRSQY